MLHGVAQQLSHAIGGRAFRVPPVPRQGKTRRRGHLNDGLFPPAGVIGPEGLAKGAGDGNRHPLRANGLHKAVHGPLSAVGHRNGVHLAVRKNFQNRLPGQAADLQAGKGPLKGV